jgi:hypothetical protein
MPINSREKGRRAEVEFKNLLKSSFPQFTADLKRNKDQDSVGGDDIIGLGGYSVECKFVANENWSLPKFWEQTCRQAAVRSTTPLLARKISQKGWWIHIALADFHPDLYSHLDRSDPTYVIVLSYAAFESYAQLHYAWANPV